MRELVVRGLVSELVVRGSVRGVVVKVTMRKREGEAEWERGDERAGRRGEGTV